MNREEHLDTIYRVWGVENTPEAKMAFWKKIKGPTGGTDLSQFPLDAQLACLEEFACPSVEPGDPFTDNYPDEREVRVEKWFWERGACPSVRDGLRYFEFHHKELLDTEEKLPVGEDTRFMWFCDKLIPMQ